MAAASGGGSAFSFQEEGFSTPLRTRAPYRGQMERSPRMFDATLKDPADVVIGGGLGGIFSALLLKKTYQALGKEGWRVVLLERNPHLLMGASLMPGRLHLGGEYPLHPETANDCLTGAVFYRQLLRGVYTEISAIQYLINKATVQAEELTSEQQREAYEQIRTQYGEIYRKFEEEGGDTNDLWGSPEDFFRALDEGELPASGVFDSGIATQEKGLDPVKTGVLLTMLLDESGVEVSLDTEVRDVEHVQPDNRFILSTSHGRIAARNVVNATWEKIYSLDCKAKRDKRIQDEMEGQEEVKRYEIFARAMLLADISECFEEETKMDEISSYLSFLKDKGGMFSPVNRNVALIYWPDKEGAYIGGSYLGGSRDHLTPKVRKKINKERKEEREPGPRSNRILEDAKRKYPIINKKGGGAKPIRLIIRPTLSINTPLEARQHKPVEVIVNGWFHALPTKATFAPLTAIEAVQHILLRMEILEEPSIKEEETDLPPIPEPVGRRQRIKEFFLRFDREGERLWVMPEELRLGDFHEYEEGVIDLSMLRFAYERRLPISIALEERRPFTSFEDDFHYLLSRKPQQLNLAGIELSYAEKNLLMEYIEEEDSALESLNLAYESFTNMMTRLINALDKNESLKQLTLRRMRFTENQFIRLLRVLSRKKLVYLDISQNDLGGSPYRMSDALSRLVDFIGNNECPTLRCLNIEEIRMREEDEDQILEAKSLRNRKMRTHKETDSFELRYTSGKRNKQHDIDIIRISGERRPLEVQREENSQLSLPFSPLASQESDTSGTRDRLRSASGFTDPVNPDSRPDAEALAEEFFGEEAGGAQLEPPPKRRRKSGSLKPSRRAYSTFTREFSPAFPAERLNRSRKKDIRTYFSVKKEK